MKVVEKRINTNYTIHIPRPLLIYLNLCHNDQEQLGVLTGKEKRELDHYVWFIYNLFKRKSIKNQNAGEYTGLHSDILNYYLTTNNCKGIIEDLVEWNVIKVNPKYQSSKFTKSYAFTDLDLVLSEELIRFSFDSKPLIKKMVSIPKQEKEFADKLLQDKIEKHLTQYAFDESVHAIIDMDLDFDNILGRMHAHNSAERVRAGHIFTSIDKYGRTYNNFTQLHKELRGELIFREGGQPLGFIDVDVSAALPFILGGLVAKEYPDSRTAKEYLSLFEAEDFYEEVFWYMQYEHEQSFETIREFNREHFKKSFISMLNGDPDVNGKFELHQFFENVFPVHARFLKRLNRNSNNGFHGVAMKVETEVMVQSVFAQLIDEGIDCILIHDGILIQKEHGQYAEMLIKDGFREVLGLEPSVRIKAA